MKNLLNTLYVTTPEAYLRLEGETVCIMIEKQKRMQVPLHHRKRQLNHTFKTNLKNGRLLLPINSGGINEPISK